VRTDLYLVNQFVKDVRRLILEFPREDIRGIVEEEREPFRGIRSIKILHYLRQDPKEFSLLCRIELIDPKTGSIDQAVSRNPWVKAQILERERNGAYITFMKGKPEKREPDSNISFLNVGGGYLVAFELDDEKIRMTYLGDQSQIRRTLDRLQRAKIRTRIISLTDAKFSPDSPLNILTEKQRAALIAAYKSGYYDIPRKISSEQLARKLNIHGSALIAHRRKAELRLLGEMLRE
jgi:hypothetical protein